MRIRVTHIMLGVIIVQFLSLVYLVGIPQLKIGSFWINKYPTGLYKIITSKTNELSNDVSGVSYSELTKDDMPDYESELNELKEELKNVKDYILKIDYSDDFSGINSRLDDVETSVENIEADIRMLN